MSGGSSHGSITKPRWASNPPISTAIGCAHSLFKASLSSRRQADGRLHASGSTCIKWMLSPAAMAHLIS
ncbi:MAG: hypothetical protein ABSA01_14515 [Anaerolineales bacterium]